MKEKINRIILRKLTAEHYAKFSTPDKCWKHLRDNYEIGAATENNNAQFYIQKKFKKNYDDEYKWVKQSAGDYVLEVDGKRITIFRFGESWVCTEFSIGRKTIAELKFEVNQLVHVSRKPKAGSRLVK